MSELLVSKMRAKLVRWVHSQVVVVADEPDF